MPAPTSTAEPESRTTRPAGIIHIAENIGISHHATSILFALGGDCYRIAAASLAGRRHSSLAYRLHSWLRPYWTLPSRLLRHTMRISSSAIREVRRCALRLAFQVIQDLHGVYRASGWRSVKCTARYTVHGLCVSTYQRTDDTTFAVSTSVNGATDLILAAVARLIWWWS